MWVLMPQAASTSTHAAWKIPTFDGVTGMIPATFTAVSTAAAAAIPTLS